MHSKKIIITIFIAFIICTILGYIFVYSTKTTETSTNSISNTEIENIKEESVNKEQLIQNTNQKNITEKNSSKNTTTESQVDEKISNMTLDEKIGQLFIVRPDSLKTKTQLTEETKSILQQYPVGGIALFSQNISSPEQLTKLTSEFQSISKIPLFIGIDEEGGTVARIANSKAFDVPKYNNMSSIGDTGDTNNAYNVGKTIGTYLKQYGINLDFAPVSDVNTNPNNPVIR